jgi:hypothetical protein
MRGTFFLARDESWLVGILARRGSIDAVIGIRDLRSNELSLVSWKVR